MSESQSLPDMADRGAGPTFRSSATSPVLYLRGLPWGATAEAVEEFLSPVPVEEVIIVNSQEDGPTGEAFVRLQTLEDMPRALQYHGQLMGKRYIEVQASSEQGMESRINRNGVSQGSCGWLRCRGLPFSVTAEDVAEIFQDYGVTKDDVTLGMHRRGSYRGCMNGEARVKCPSQELAEKARMALNMSQVGRRYVEIYLMSKAEVLQSEDLPQTERQHQEFLKQVSSCLIRASGLPYKATVADVMEFFSGYVQDQNQILMLTNPDRRPKGEALVWMADPQEAATVRKELNLKKLGGRYIELLPPGASEVSTALAMSKIGFVYVPCTTDQYGGAPHIALGSQCSGFAWPGLAMCGTMNPVQAGNPCQAVQVGLPMTVVCIEASGGLPVVAVGAAGSPASSCCETPWPVQSCDSTSASSAAGWADDV